MSYAEGTEVSTEKSRLEMERLLGKHGATRRMMGADEDAGFAFVVFELDKRQVRLRVPVPTVEQLIAQASEDSKRRPAGWYGMDNARRKTWAQRRRDQIERERWRQLLLLVKAKLEMIALGLSTVEREFLADIFLADGRTVHETLAGAIEKNYIEGGVPRLLLGSGGGG